MRRWIGLALALSGIAGCREAFVAHVDVAARAESVELSVNRLAEFLALNPTLPAEPEFAELLARRWVEYSYFGIHAAAGDSLLDSGVVHRVMWPDVRGAVIDSFRQIRTADLVEVSPAQVDSAYRVGEMRFLAHVLKSAAPEMSPPVRDSIRAIAESLYERLAAGEPWSVIVTLSDDEASRERNGALGIIRRGETVPRFENAAFALGPGEVSQVVETPSGFHIVLRPALEDVRDEFAAGVRFTMVARRDSLYERELLEARQVDVSSRVVPAIREVAAAPARARGRARVLATYDGGRFTVDDLVRWLQALPPQVQGQIGSAPDDQVTELLRSMVARELAYQAADSAGIQLSPAQWSDVRSRYRALLTRIRQLTGLDPDSMNVPGSTVSQRLDLASALVDQYLEESTRDTRRFVPVPAFLAELLIENQNWEVNTAGIHRSVQRALALRAASADSTMGRQP